MERYWDRRAREDAFHYVDSRERLGAPDLDSFWQGGEQVVDRVTRDLGVQLRPDQTALEIGCGIGRLTRVLARRVRFVYAVDISQEMLDRARRYNPELDNVQWIHGDGRTLADAPDTCIDAVMSFVVFQHLPEPQLTYGYVREMGRVLRPGGWAAFQVSNDPRVHERPSAVQALSRAVRDRRYHNPAWYGSAVETRELRSAAAEGGMEIERLEGEGTQYCLVLARRRD